MIKDEMLSIAVLPGLVTRFQDAAVSAAAEIFNSPLVIGFCIAGLAVLALWKFRYGGFDALQSAPIRRNRMNVLFPVILFCMWLGLMAGAIALQKTTFGDVHSTGAELFSYAANAAIELGMITLMLGVSVFIFARGLKGLGLNIKTIPADLKWSVVYLLAIYPLIFIGLWLVLFGGSLVSGPDFTLMEHESLDLLISTENVFLRFLVAAFAAFVVPVFEELLFRGYVQSSISSLTGKPWAAIIATSIVFTVLHPWQHQVSLMFLSIGFGYAYERSGSLLRPIIMHMIFNGLSVAVNLMQIA